MRRTPEIVIHALQPLPIRFGGVAVLPLTFGHALLLDRLDSPALPGGQLTGLPLYRAVYVLTRPARATEDALAAGPDSFDVTVTRFSKSIAHIEENALAFMIFAQVQAAYRPNRKTIARQNPDDPPIDTLGDNGLGDVLNCAAGFFEITHATTLREFLDFPIAAFAALQTAAAIRAGDHWGEPAYDDEEEPAAAPA